MRTLIIDTSYLIYRSYFSNKLIFDKQPVGAFFGFARTVIALIKNWSPDELIFAMDTREPTWRHKMFKDYKAGRTPMEEDMKTQIPMIIDWCNRITNNVFTSPGFEADDIIATISAGLPNIDSKTEDEHIIFSADQDLYQLLIKDNIFFVRQNKIIKDYFLFDKTNFIEKFEIDPLIFVDYKALVGDKSDNLVGVNGIGPKTAAKILNSTGGLKNLFRVLDIEHESISEGVNINNTAFLNNPKNEKTIQKILDNSEQIKQTYKLARLQNISDINLQNSKFDLSGGVELLKKYNFNSLIKQTISLGYNEDENTLF